MNGIECLRAELVARGFTKAQANSKVVIGTLEILAKADGRYSDMDKLVQEKQELQERIAQYQERRNALAGTVAKLQHDESELVARINSVCDREYGKTIAYINSFFKAVSECETAEGRDRMKLAQMYFNSTCVDTKYDNTAFIIGLASILSGGQTGAIDELRKINPKIPGFELKTSYFGNYWIQSKDDGKLAGG